MPVIVAQPTAETWARLSSGDSATGILFVRAGSFCFPEKGWDDFPFACLTAWTSNAVILHGSGIEMDNGFMDGDFAFRVRRLDRLPLSKAKVRMSFLRGGRARPGAPVLTLSLRSHALALGRTARALLAAAAAHRRSSAPEVQALHRALADLRAAAELSLADLRRPARR
jgi:hypothetical protein